MRTKRSILGRTIDWIFGHRYLLRHECGAKHVFRARSLDAAKRKAMRFLGRKAYGDWAMYVDQSVIQRQFELCSVTQLVEQTAGIASTDGK